MRRRNLKQMLDSRKGKWFWSLGQFLGQWAGCGWDLRVFTMSGHCCRVQTSTCGRPRTQPGLGRLGVARLQGYPVPLEAVEPRVVALGAQGLVGTSVADALVFLRQVWHWALGGSMGAAITIADTVPRGEDFFVNTREPQFPLGPGLGWFQGLKALQLQVGSEPVKEAHYRRGPTVLS